MPRLNGSSEHFDSKKAKQYGRPCVADPAPKKGRDFLARDLSMVHCQPCLKGCLSTLIVVLHVALCLYTVNQLETIKIKVIQGSMQQAYGNEKVAYKNQRGFYTKRWIGSHCVLKHFNKAMDSLSRGNIKIQHE